MTPRRPRYHLIDLVMVVLLCGLLAAVAGSIWRVVSAFRGPAPVPPPTDSGTTLFASYLAFLAWLIAWAVIRAKRKQEQ
jgi:hypothetical protein